MTVLGGVGPVLDELRRAGVDVDVTSRRLAEYSYDASNYRVPPVAVVFPRSTADVCEVVTSCVKGNVPIVSRGGGTSMAGNAIGAGVVLDFSRHMNAVLSVDAESKSAVVEPGIVLSELAEAVSGATGGILTYAPDPSSRSRATVGGAIGNLIDRVRLGYVVDYIYFHTPVWSFAVFNLADTFISLGAALVILDEFLFAGRAKATARDERSR